MSFDYPNRPHARKHGPAGYTNYETFKPWLRDDFHFRCVYCLERERWYPSGHAAFGVDHARPKSKPENASLICDYENLLYVCNRCNSAKRDDIFVNPCLARMADHVRVAEDGTIAGLTVEVWDLVRILGLNKIGVCRIRQRYLRTFLLYQTQPDNPEVRALHVDAFGYPYDLPNLAALRPESNSRPEGLAETFSRQHEEGRLPAVYW